MQMEPGAYAPGSIVKWSEVLGYAVKVAPLGARQELPPLIRCELTDRPLRSTCVADQDGVTAAGYADAGTAIATPRNLPGQAALSLHSSPLR